VSTPPTPRSQKSRGAYYTPDSVVATLTAWAIRRRTDRLLDPACGDGRFIAAHRPSVGIEDDPSAVREAMNRAPLALIHKGDFFSWAANTKERFQCAAGNPPFIRYQAFSGSVRETALSLCHRLGADFSGLTSSWAPFLVATAHLLTPGGRMAFVVPAEVGHAPYAAPLIEYLLAQFEEVHIVPVAERIFPQLSEDCWLLYADGFGGCSTEIRLSALDCFEFMSRPPAVTQSVSANEWRNKWQQRLRPFLMSSPSREAYQRLAKDPASIRLGTIAKAGIGYVTGANEFFHLRPSQAEQRQIGSEFLLPTVRNGRALPDQALTEASVAAWKRRDEPILLLRLPREGDLPVAVRRYLGSDAGRKARMAYKCRNRTPWYSVPDVNVPDYFLSYMSSSKPNLVQNLAQCSCTNSVHAVRLRHNSDGSWLRQGWRSPLTELSCEVEGHPLGGGMLKLEPGEAGNIVLCKGSLTPADAAAIQQGVRDLRRWRHSAT
jgi:tRNA1(Val) A37 N6-methylase TrmN6